MIACGALYPRELLLVNFISRVNDMSNKCTVQDVTHFLQLPEKKSINERLGDEPLLRISELNFGRKPRSVLASKDQTLVDPQNPRRRTYYFIIKL